ncbi:substrate-binding periplasmic protein [Bdellovibrio bacteriovorus]|uniref:substrate-binding periplasmic protein n=1 Tax=Bdellovibrio bacteriovorus TaxID=959 RepID=UPI0035A72C03
MLRVFIILFVMTAFSQKAWVTEKELTVAIIDFAPFYGVDAEKNPVGLLSQRVQKILKIAGYKMRPIFVPAKRMAYEISTGNINVWMGVSSFPEFRDTTYIGDELFLEMTLSIWAYNKEDLPSDLFRDSTKGVVIFGYSYGGLLESLKKRPADKYIEAKSIDQASLILKNKRAQYIINYNAPMYFWLKNNPTQKLYSQVIKSIPCHIVVSKKTPDAERVLIQLERALRKLKTSDNF